MEVIKYYCLDPLKMKHIESCGSTSKLYLKDGELYKIFDIFFASHYGEDLYKKIQAMEDIKLDDIIMPKKAIMQNNIFLGYTMDYYKDYKNLTDYFNHDRYVNVKDILNATKKASLILKNLHSKEIILKDYSFENILTNEDKDIKVCDIDSCLYKNYKGIPVVPDFMNYYYKKVVYKRHHFDENFDRQTLLFGMIKSIFYHPVFNIEKFDTLSDKVKTLKELRHLYVSLLTNPDIEVPYLDEVICDDEDYVIDRDKQKVNFFND